MKIVLIQVPWSRTTGGPLKRLSTRFVSSPPLGLLYLASFVEQHGHEAAVLDLEADHLDAGELAGRIRTSGADIIGLSSTTPVFPIVCDYARRLATLGLPIVLGGPHVTALRAEAFPAEFDFAVTHEGEHTLLELMEALERGRELGAIAGLIYRDGDRVIVNPPRPFIDELDSLPFPARAKLDAHAYRFQVPGKGMVAVANIALTRGCPFQCAFCAEPQNTGRRLRSRSARCIVDEVETIRQLGIRHLFMVDSTLTVNKRLIAEFCRELIARNLDVTFEGHTRANLVDRPLLELMRKAGLVRLAFGLESTDPNVLRLMRKEISPEDVRTAVRLCRELGIAASIGTMLGNPGDTRETVLRTAWFVRSIPEIKYAPMAVAVPLPGTELQRLAAAGMHGLRLLETGYAAYTRYGGGVLEVDGMSPAELRSLQRRALVIMHSTPSKAFAVIRQFGLVNLASVLTGMVKSELASRFSAATRARAPRADRLLAGSTAAPHRTRATSWPP